MEKELYDLRRQTGMWFKRSVGKLLTISLWKASRQTLPRSEVCSVAESHSLPVFTNNFIGYLHYQEVLERMSRLEALNRRRPIILLRPRSKPRHITLASPSLVNLHAPTTFPELARSQSAPVSFLLTQWYMSNHFRHSASQ